MSDPASMSILPAVSSSEASAVAGIKPPSKDAQGENKGSFLDFLNAFNGLSSAKSGVQDGLLSGSTLPLSTETAETGHLPLSASSIAQTQIVGAGTGSQQHTPGLTEQQTQTSADKEALDHNIFASPTALTSIQDLLVKPDSSSSVSSAALASRLAGLAQAGGLSAHGASTTAVSQPLPITDDQIATAQQVNSDVKSLAADLPLQSNLQAKIAPIALPVGKEMSSKPGPVIAARATSTAAVNGGPELNVSSLESAKFDITESNALFSDQVKKMVVEQQQVLNPEKLLNQPGLTTTTSNAATSQPVSASQLGIQTTSPMLTSETVPVTGHQVTVSEQFGRPEWNQGMGKQVLWMANQNIRTAEIRLNPAHLGPIEVRIEMEDDQVNLTFSSRHSAVREAVEQAMPRLREMFEESGLNLADTDVSQQSFAEQRSQEADDYSNHQMAGSSDLSMTGNAENLSDPGTTQSLDMGLVDYYI